MGLQQFFFIFFVAFIAFVFVFHGEVSVSRSESSVVLGDLTYDYQALKAPVATGMMLQIQSFILTNTPFGPFLRRVLLNDNGLHILRELAKQIPYVPPLHFPLRRLSSESHSWHQQAATEEKEKEGDIMNLLKAITNKEDSQEQEYFSESRVMAYHRAYLSSTSGNEKDEMNTPTKVMERTLNALEGEDGLQNKFKMFVSINKEDVLKQAKESSLRYAEGKPLSILDGVPIAVKDMIQVKGYQMKDGSASHEDVTVAQTDDPSVSNLRQLGAIIMGTTTMTEGGVTPLGYCAAEKGPFNAWDTDYYSGGSSSGSAVAVALGITPITIGFDGGGSIRIPAAFNGVAGLATTFGRVGFESRLGSTMIKCGPIAATVDDTAIGYVAMGSAGPDHFYGEMYGSDGVPPMHLKDFPLKSTKDMKTLAGVRVGVFSEHFNDGDENVVKACQTMVDQLKSLGASVVPVAFPNLGWFRLAHAIKISTEFALAWDTSMGDKVAGSLLEANTRITAALGSTVSAKEAMAAEKLRRYAFNLITEMFKNDVDVIATPTLPILPPKIPTDALLTGESNVPLVIDMMKYIFQANFLGLPALTIPVPPLTTSTTTTGDQTDVKNDVNLPIGFQLLGDHWSEAKLLTIAKNLEENIGCPKRSPYFFDAIQN